MAYVAKSKTTLSSILANIDKLFANRAELAEDWSQYYSSDVNYTKDCIKNIITNDGTAYETFMALPSSYFPHESRIKYYIELENNVEYQFTVSTREAVKLPYFMDSWSAKNIITDPELISVALKRREQIVLLTEEKSEFKNKAISVYRSVPSINALVKVWHPAWELLSDSVREKLKQKKVSKPKPKPQPQQMDENDDDIAEIINGLNAAYTAAKISQ